MMERHPLSAAFPDMSKEEYGELLLSVKEIGIQNPIVLFEDKIIDGWHRYRASLDLDVDCPFVDLPETSNPRSYVIAQNATRRNLTKSQIAISVVAVNAWHPSGAKGNLKDAPEEHLQEKTIDEMAEMAKTSRTTIRKAKTIMAQAVPEVVEAVKSGKVGISKASAIASLNKDKQVEALSKVGSEIKKESDVPYDVAPEDDEIAMNNERQRLDMESMNRLLDADDKLAEAFFEIKRLNAELAVVKSSRDGYMNKCNEQIKMIKSLQKKLDKLSKE